MNRGFWPIANQGRGLEAFAQSARATTYPVVAEWSPALFSSGTAGTPTAGTIAANTLCVSGIMLHPGAYLHVPYEGNEPNRDQALVIALPSTESAFVVAPVRHKLNDAEYGRALGNPRGKAAICIQPQRNDITNVASGAYSIAVGQNTKANSVASVAVGSAASATASYALALGSSAQCSGNSGVSVGLSANSIGAYALAVGTSSTASAQGSTAIGYASNSAAASATAIGESATASGAASTAIGLSCNTNNLTRAVALGWTNTSAYQCTLSFAAHNISTAGDAAWHLSQQCVETSTAASQELLFREAGNQRIGVAASTAMQFRCTVIGRQRAGTAGTLNDVAGWSIEGVIKRTAAGSPVIVGQTTVHTAADAGASTWTAVVSADTANNALIVTVTGEANKTIRWLAYWQLTRVA